MTAWKIPVRLATTGNVALLSGLVATDGVTPASGDRVLVKDQTAKTENGIYTAASGAWARATDANTSALMNPELCVRVSEGAVNAHSQWVLTTPAPITLGVTGLVFAPLRESPVAMAHLMPGADAFAKIAAAIASLPATGGCVDARGITGTQAQTVAATVTVDRPVTLLLGAVDLRAIASPAFLVSASTTASALTVIGLDPKATLLEAAQANVVLFRFVGDFFTRNGDGASSFALRRCGFSGASLAGTVLLDTQSYPTTDFEDGLLLVEECMIANFADTALKIGASVYFNRIHRNEFINNHLSVFLENNTEASITENYFEQGPHGGPTLTLIGPMHRVNNNYFTRNTLSDDSNAPDILLQPVASWPSQAGGYIWIEDNRFMGERENLDPTRRRIKLSASDRTLVAGPVIVEGNYFLGPGAGGAVSASGTTATMKLTQSATAAFYTQGMVAGKTRVTIFGAANAVLNGVFTVQSIVDSATFTYALASSTMATDISAAVGLTDATAIQLDNPHLPWDVRGNFFLGYGVLIDDNQSPPGATQNTAFGWGQSLFVDNRVTCPKGGYKVFANQGNNFTWIRPPANSATRPMSAWPASVEALALRNRVPQSEAMSTAAAWPTVNGLTVTPGQADPYGVTTRAYQLTLTGTLTSQHVGSSNIDLTGLSSGSRLVIKFWAKQGTLSSLSVGLYDATTGGWYGNFFEASLGPKWKQYKFVTNQLFSLSHAFQLLFYPGDVTFCSGSVYVFAPQISDDDSDYYPSGASAIVDTSVGRRFEKGVVFAGGLRTDSITPNTAGAGVSFAAAAYTPRKKLGLASTGSVAFNGSLSNHHQVTIGANTAFSFTNLKDGATYFCHIIQAAVGGPFNATWPSNLKWAGGMAGTLSTGALMHDVLVGVSDGTNVYVTAFVKNVV